VHLVDPCIAMGVLLACETLQDKHVSYNEWLSPKVVCNRRRDGKKAVRTLAIHGGLLLVLYHLILCTMHQLRSVQDKPRSTSTSRVQHNSIRCSHATQKHAWPHTAAV
jgi:hypothetical protein